MWILNLQDNKCRVSSGEVLFFSHSALDPTVLLNKHRVLLRFAEAFMCTREGERETLVCSERGRVAGLVENLSRTESRTGVLLLLCSK